MLIDGDRRDAAVMKGFLVGRPGIKGGISREMGGKEAQRYCRLPVEREKVGDVAFVKGEGVFGQDDIAVVSGNGRDDS